MIAALQLLLFEIYALALLLSCFCRLALTRKSNTVRAVRWTFTALSIVAACCVAAPWLTGYQPDAMATALVGVIALTQIVTSHHWRKGVPAQFLKEPKR